MLNPFSRTELLLGRDAMERLASSRVADIYKTRVDPPARVMRRELKKRGVEHLRVCYSTEEPLRPRGADGQPSRTPGSMSFVPGVAGMMMAGEVVRTLIGREAAR